jgi:hypothetical protein
MNRARILRLLRISASALCGVVCLVLAALWARSYSSNDTLYGPLPRSFALQASTQPGHLQLLVSGPAYRLMMWEITSYPIQAPKTSGTPQWQSPRFKCEIIQGRLHVQLPIALLVLASGLLAAVLGIRTYRFSLRTLLIATTLVAVVLGLATAFR